MKFRCIILVFTVCQNTHIGVTSLQTNMLENALVFQVNIESTDSIQINQFIKTD